MAAEHGDSNVVRHVTYIEGVEHIGSQVAKKASVWFGEGAALLAEPPVIRNHRRSFMIRFKLQTLTEGVKSILVKVPRYKPSDTRNTMLIGVNRESIRREYAALEKFWELFSEQPEFFTAIRPLDFWPEWNAIVMEELQAKSLHHLALEVSIYGLDIHWRRLREALERTGGWLRVFHEQFGATQYQTMELPYLREQVEREFISVDSSGSLDRFSDYRDVLLRLCERYTGSVVPVALLHGDFVCRNVLVTTDEGRIAGIDTKLRRRGPVQYDLATLIVDLISRKSRVFTSVYRIDTKFLDACTASILKEYSRWYAPDAGMLNFYCSLAVLKRWNEDEMRLKLFPDFLRVPARVFHAMLTGYLVKLLQHFLKQADHLSAPRASYSPDVIY